MCSDVVQLNTGCNMPLLGLGTCKITDQSQMDVAVDAALSNGYRLFDTAKGYANEAVLGDALHKYVPAHGLKRSDIFITTKVAIPADPTEEKVRELVHDSAEKLRTSYIDLVLVHYPKSDARENDEQRNADDRAVVWLGLTKLKEQGTIRSVGVSNFEARHMEEVSKINGVIPAVNQIEYHPHFTRESIHHYCNQHGVFVQAFSSLGRNHPDLISDPVVTELAEKYGVTPQVLLLSFAASQRIGVVPKSADPARIASNACCAKLVLSDDDVNRLRSCNRNKNYIRRTTGWLVR